MNVTTHRYQHQSFDKRRAGPFLSVIVSTCYRIKIEDC
jgi:hypothetical protein